MKKTKKQQIERLKEICRGKDVGFESMQVLLDSVRRKMIQRNNYHQETINNTIEKVIEK